MAREYNGKYVYFVQQGLTGNIKIGYSENLKSRISTLQTSSPEKLRLLHAIPASGQQDETRFHEMFKHKRSHGEWFEYCADIISFIEEDKEERQAKEMEDLHNWVSFLEERVRFLSLLKNKIPTFIIEEIQAVNFKKIHGLLFLQDIHIYCRWISGGSLVYDENSFFIALSSKDALGLIHYISLSAEVSDGYPHVVDSNFAAKLHPEDDHFIKKFLMNNPMWTDVENICFQGMVGSINRQIVDGQEQGSTLEIQGPIKFFGVSSMHSPFDQFNPNHVVFGRSGLNEFSSVYVDGKNFDSHTEEELANHSFITIPYHEWKEWKDKAQPVN